MAPNVVRHNIALTPMSLIILARFQQKDVSKGVTYLRIVLRFSTTDLDIGTVKTDARQHLRSMA